MKKIISQISKKTASQLPKKSVKKTIFESPKKVILEIIETVTERRREIILKRWGLIDGQKKTLQNVGDDMENLTRERIRQIEEQGISQLKPHLEKTFFLKEIIYQTLSESGGILPENFLFKKLEERKVIVEELDKNAISFFLHKLFSDHFERIVESKKFQKGWKLKEKDLKEYEEIVKHLEDFLEKRKKTFLFKENQKEIESYFKKKGKKFDQAFFENLFEISKKFQKDPYKKWGLASWPHVTLKNLREKIYFVLKEEGKPLHFREITEKINNHLFFKKKAKSESVHNELLRDNRFVLVGKGKYYLKNTK